MALLGEFKPPGDQSISHLLVLMSILAQGEVRANGLAEGEDIKNSLELLRALGGEVQGTGSDLTITGLGGKPKINPQDLLEINCEHSALTLNFGAGILAGLPGNYLLDGSPQLGQSPLERLANPLRQMGALVETTNSGLPLRLSGGDLHGIEYISNKINPQLKGAVLLAALSAAGHTQIQETVPTPDHTEQMICALGGMINFEGPLIKISPQNLTLPVNMEIPGDPSLAAFFLIGAAIIPDSKVTARDILLSSSRIGFLKVLSRMGASISINLEQENPNPDGQVTVEYNGNLQATEITEEEFSSLIDEVPMLVLAASKAQGVTIFRGVRELKTKGTDLLTGLKEQLGALGAQIWQEGDDLFVGGFTGIKTIFPSELDSGGDRDLAMTLHMALAVSGITLPVVGDSSIARSYPLFKDELAWLYSK